MPLLFRSSAELSPSGAAIFLFMFECESVRRVVSRVPAESSRPPPPPSEGAGLLLNRLPRREENKKLMPLSS